MPDDINVLLGQAGQLHRTGKLADAEKLFELILSRAPQQPDALHFLGIIRHQLGKTAEGLEFLNQALAIDDRNASIHRNKGVILMAINCFNEALSSFDKAIELKPNYAEAFNDRGDVLRKLGQFDEAILSFDKAIELKPNYAEAFNNRGSVLRKLGQFDEALSSFDKAIELTPNYADAFNNRGIVLRKLGQFDEALSSFDKAIELKPNYAEAFNNRGFPLYELERFDEAILSFDKAIKLKPNYAEAFNKRGFLLYELERFDEAILSFDKAIELMPNEASAFNNRGHVLHKLERFDEAILSFDRAFRINPDYHEAARSLAFVHLILGEFQEGWRHYDSRFKVEYGKNDEFVRTFIPPFIKKWNGDLSYRGELILFQLSSRIFIRGIGLYSGQGGIGEVFQFIRYVQVLADMGMRISILTYPGLTKFLSQLNSIQSIYPIDHVFGPGDCQWFPLKALPMALNTTIESMPNKVPYLGASQERVKYWQNKISNNGKTKIGIAWQSGDPKRSCTLNDFRPIAEVSNIELISLHKEFDIDQFNSCGFADKFVASQLLLSETMDWENTAAVMMHCDLIISVNTAIAHLAGALARPTWIALEKVPDWRWLLDRSDSPWYPTARLFRKKQRGNWDQVFEEISVEVQKLIQAKT